MALRLPRVLREQWSSECYNALPQVLKLVDMDDWLNKISKQKEYQHEHLVRPKSEQNGMMKRQGNSFPATSTINHIKTSSSSPVSMRSAGAASTSTTARPTLPPPTCLVCKDAKHYINECPSFTAMSPIFKANRCPRCAVGLDHTARTCKKSVRCTVGGCSKPGQHITLLHGSTFKIKKSTENHPTTAQSSTVDPEDPATTTETEHATSMRITTQSGPIVRQKALFKVVPVCLQAGNQSFNTFAFLDTGSDNTLIKKEVAANNSI